MALVVIMIDRIYFKPCFMDMQLLTPPNAGLYSAGCQLDHGKTVAAYAKPLVKGST